MRRKGLLCFSKKVLDEKRREAYWRIATYRDITDHAAFEATAKRYLRLRNLQQNHNAYCPICGDEVKNEQAERFKYQKYLRRHNALKEKEGGNKTFLKN